VLDMRGRVAQIVGVLLAAVTARAGGAPLVYDSVAGGDGEYRVAAGDTVWAITGRFTMSPGLLRALNDLPDPGRLVPGMRLRVSDRHIVPRRRPDGVVIALAERTLYWFKGGELVERFPVGIGRPDWETPPGSFRIVGRRVDPVWRVPASIQEEMRARGEPVVTRVAAGPGNPLGKYWIQLSAPGYGLHGTNAPGSVGKHASHGCLRLLPEHVERLFHEAPDGTSVDIVYEPVKIARGPDGGVLLEVHRDVRHGNRVDAEAIAALITTAGLADAVDPARVADVAVRAWGVPEDVSRPAGIAPAAATVP
jgi:L,D-transpeptidase ErfK/SrfK